MFRIKQYFRKLPLFAAVLLLCMPTAAQAQQDIIDISQLEGGQINYRTTIAQKGNLEKEINAMGRVYYPLGCDVCFEGENAKFVAYAVAAGDAVKAGDVLMYYTTESSNVTLTRMELNLKRAQEELTSGIRERQEQIAQLRAEISAEKDSYEKEKKTLELRILEIELEQYRYEQEYSIAEQSQELEAMKARSKNRALLAPSDGVVAELADKKVDEPLAQGELLIRLQTEEVMLIEIDNSSGSFRYNMPVSVSVGVGRQTEELTGRVVAADDALEESRQGTKAYVQLDLEYADARKLRNIHVSAASMWIENVLIVPSSALSVESGKHFVSRLDEGTVQKRYVQADISIGSQVWILAGVSEGDVLILD